MKYLVIIIALATFLFTSCDSEDDTPVVVPENSSDLILEFNFKVGNEILETGTAEYIFGNEDTVSIDQFKFILSNLTLKKSDGTEWKDEDGYYLIKASSGAGNYQMTIENVPLGEYSSMEFYIGMDSAMNFKPDDFPILFQQEGMYWDWNTGYKFLLFEGRYFSSSLSTPNNAIGFIAHIGDMINLEIPQFTFPNTLNLKLESENRISLDVNLEEIYTNPNVLSLSEVNNRNIMGGPNAVLLSTNYSEGMINLISVE